MSQPLVTAVIVNWNLKKDLGECIDSLFSVDYEPLKIIVVDNASSDGSVDYVTAQYPLIELLSLPTNQGYAGGVNQGILRALEMQADYVFVLNNDTVIEPQTVSRLVEVLEADVAIGIVAPKVLFYHQRERIFSLGDRVYPWLPLPLGFGYGKRDHPRYKTVMEFDYVTGCAMMIRQKVFHEVGYFDPTYFMYYEDADFCRRVRDHHYRIFCVGNAIIYHKAAQGTRQDKPRFIQMRARNRVRFYRRYRHGPHPWLTYIALGMMAAWYSFWYIIRGDYRLISPYFRGLWEGWHQPDE